MRIICHINSMSKGGAERVMLQLAIQLGRRGHQVLLATTYQDQVEYEVPKEVERIILETPEQRNENFAKRNLRRITSLRKLCKEWKPDVVLSFMKRPNIRSLIATRGLPVKCVISVRVASEIEYPGKTGRLLRRFLLPMADGCVFQTKEAQAWFPEKMQKKSTIIPNEVAEDFFNTDRHEGSDVVSVGRLTPQKNFSLMIDSFCKISEKYPETNLKIYGQGPLKEQLEEQIRSMGMENRIFLMGSTSEVSRVLSQARAFVLSSDFEGLPNALMEALAVGVPSIATDCQGGGARALIQDGVNGFLVPVKDAEKLSSALDKLLADETLRQKLSENAKQMAKEYHPEKIVENWERYLESVIKGEN